MDLVDLDKVLDDFETLEAQQQPVYQCSGNITENGQASQPVDHKSNDKNNIENGHSEDTVDDVQVASTLKSIDNNLCHKFNQQIIDSASSIEDFDNSSTVCLVEECSTAVNDTLVDALLSALETSCCQIPTSNFPSRFVDDSTKSILEAAEDVGKSNFNDNIDNDNQDPIDWSIPNGVTSSSISPIVPSDDVTVVDKEHDLMSANLNPDNDDFMFSSESAESESLLIQKNLSDDDKLLDLEVCQKDVTVQPQKEASCSNDLNGLIFEKIDDTDNDDKVDNVKPKPVGFSFTDNFDDVDDDVSLSEMEQYLSDVILTSIFKEPEAETPLTDDVRNFDDGVDIEFQMPEQENSLSLSDELAQVECGFVRHEIPLSTTVSGSVIPKESHETADHSVSIVVDDENPEIVGIENNIVVQRPTSLAKIVSRDVAEEIPYSFVSESSEDTAIQEIILPPAVSNVLPDPAHPILQPSGNRQLVTVSTIEEEAGSSYKPTESELQLGKTAPVWIPDNDTSVCMLCELRFSVIKRRHHCRACGRVLCADCCNLKAKLPYVENKEVRICSSCSERLKKIEDYEKGLLESQQQQQSSQNVAVASAVPPDPSSSGTTSPIAVPTTSSATSGILTNVSGNAEAVAQSPGPPDPISGGPSSSAKLPSIVPVGVLKRGSIKKEPKQVIFSDGIKPGGDLTESPSSSVSTPSQPPDGTLVTSKLPVTYITVLSPRQRELQCFMTDNGETMPPIISDGQMKTIDKETLQQLFQDANKQPVTFAIKKNLSAKVSLTELDCCLKMKVWCYASDGLRNVAQDELLIVVVAMETDQNIPPFDVLRYFNALYEDILKGKPMSDMSYSVASQLGIQIAPEGFLGNKDNAGFLHARPTSQCLQNLCLPEEPFLIGILIQKVEVPWAKVLPLRLALRLGAEYKYYPWSVISDPYRKPVVAEIGHTIMSVLNDFRNFTYNIAHLAGSWVTLEDEKTIINIPCEQYNQMQKTLSSSNEHVLAWATSFSAKADSHLVCVQQNDSGSYISQTINKEDGVRKVTGGCFVIFNASLKAGGPIVRSSIVEDGVMVQVRPETMEQIREKLHRQQNFRIQNEPSASPSNSQPCVVEIRWGPMVQSKLKISSSVDGRSLSDAPRYRLYGKVVEVSSQKCTCRLVALFLLPTENGASPSEPDDLHSIVKKISIAVGTVLLPQSDQLIESGLTTVGVRFTLGSDMVEYSLGANGQPLPDNLVPLMDDRLIPILHNRVGDNRYSLKVELTLRLLNL